jgi:hypothetical protein
MTLEEIFAQGGPIADAARKFVEASAAFLAELSKNNLTLDFGPSDNTDNDIDYDEPASASYRRTYKPITAAEIVQANKAMTEAISGEKWVEGFLTLAALLLVARP